MNTDFPFISIIIPIRNEEDKIFSTLNSIINQNYQSDRIEIIISDGCSYDNTINIIKEIASQDSRIKIINNDYNIVSSGFNLGLNEAKGDIIVRVDGHCEISSNYISCCVALLKSKDADIVGGCIKTESNGIIGRAISIAQSSLFGVGGVKFRNSSCNTATYVDTLPFGAHCREVFSDIGGYDEEMIYNQDDEFNLRATIAGKKIWMDPSIITKYYSRSSYGKLFKQYFNYGCFKVRGIQKRKQVISIRHIIPSIFVMVLSGAFILGYSLNQSWVSFSVFIFYLIINILSSIYISPKTSSIPMVFVSFWILHLGYGLGFIWGLLKFASKWGDTELKDCHFNKEKFLTNSTVTA